LQVSLAFRTAATLAEAAQTLTSADPAKVPYPTMQREESYPVQFTVDYPDRPLDRLTTGLRILVAIPILIVLAAVAGGGGWESSADDAQSIAAAGGLLFFGPLLMILFRKKYRGGGSTGTWSCSGSALYLAEQATTRAAEWLQSRCCRLVGGLAAEAHALVGAEGKARLLLERADFHLSKVTADDPMVGVFGRDQLGGFVGACQLRLDDPTGAEAALQDSARRLGAGKKHRSVILADLSTAFVLQDDPEQACAVLHQVVDLVELTGSAAADKRRAFAAGRQLSRWRNEAFVQRCRIGCWRLPAEPLRGE
jgi:hypothetical protein